MKVVLTFDLETTGNRNAVNKELLRLGYSNEASGTRLPNTTWWATMADGFNLDLQSKALFALFRSVGGKPERLLLCEVGRSALLP